jgi:hypothetical protein
MRKHLLHLTIGASLVMLFGFQQTMAQEVKTSEVHITISEGDEVTTDTTFELKERQNPEMVKKMISHLAGEDIHKTHKIIVHTEEGDYEEKDIIVSVHTDDDMEWAEKGEEDEHMEVYVIKKDDGKEVKVMKKKIKVEIEEEEDTGKKKKK